MAEITSRMSVTVKSSKDKMGAFSDYINSLFRSKSPYSSKGQEQPLGGRASAI
jgi:hypothetical protein